jgi:hypothetical protein
VPHTSIPLPGDNHFCGMYVELALSPIRQILPRQTGYAMKAASRRAKDKVPMTWVITPAYPSAVAPSLARQRCNKIRGYQPIA